MNVNLEWSTSFLAIAAHNDHVFPNSYNIVLGFLTQCDDARQQNIAFDRVKFMLGEMFYDGIFIGAENPLVDPLFQISPTKMVILPEEAYDQIVACALFCKLNAVMEGRMSLEFIKLSSQAGDNMWYSFTDEENLGIFAAKPIKNKKFNKGVSWWNRPDILTFDASGKIEVTDWSEIGLAWELAAESTSVTDVEEKTTIIDIKSQRLYNKFTPEIIEGGKKTIDES